ncbi:hypothetical protein Bca101_010011 [Brassica carinata]
MVKQEIIFVPYPILGHLLVTIELAKSLIKRDHRIHTITILHWTLPLASHADLFAKSLIASEPQIRLYALPEVKDPPPFDLFLKATEAYVLEFARATVHLVRDALSTLVSSRDGSDPVRVAGLVLDFFCVPLIKVGNEFNLPSYLFLTCNAGFLGMVKYLPERNHRIGSMLYLSSEYHQIPGYVSSMLSKIEEIARALEISGHRFLWSIRTEKGGPYDLLPDGFMDRTASNGLVCGWAPQVEVLINKAIGGFVSQCGWKSVWEPKFTPSRFVNRRKTKLT